MSVRCLPHPNYNMYGLFVNMNEKHFVGAVWRSKEKYRHEIFIWNSIFLFLKNLLIKMFFSKIKSFWEKHLLELFVSNITKHLDDANGPTCR